MNTRSASSVQSEALITSNVFAVIVSFNGGGCIEETIRRLRGQVGHLFVVDNGSTDYSLEVLRHWHSMGDIDLLELNENKGIGCALNLGVKKAADLGYQWVLTMDQDSSPEKNMIAMMLSYAYHNPSIKCLSPNFASRIYSGRTSKEGAVSYAITSGNLVNVCVFEKAGPYNEDYFIDCIDFEFSLRVRAADFEIHKVPDAVMYHDVGVVTNRIRRIVSRFYTQHSPVRRYYMFRNLLLLAKEHFLFDFLFVAKLVLGQVIFFTLMIIFEQRLIENLLLIAKGMRDGLMDKRGRYCEVEE